jgi:PAS domain S-box-containing protein
MSSSDRRLTQIPLDDSEGKYRGLVEHSPYCIHEIDLGGALVSMNPAGLRMMGVEDESAIQGMPYLDAVCDGDRARVAALLERALGGEPSDFQFQAANGLYFRSTFVPMEDGERRVVKLMGLTLDVTPEVHAQQAVAKANAELELKVALRTAELQLANDNLARSNRDLARFASVASHDLRAPLRTISGFANVLGEDLELTAEQREHFDYIVDGVRRMDRLIEDVLNFSGVNAKVHPRHVDVDDTLRETLVSLGSAVRDSGAEVAVSGTLPRVFVDPGHLSQILLNLLSNAIKFAGDVPPRIEVSAQREGAGWRLSVRDEGIGVAPGRSELLFEMFRRDVGAEYEGTGIGLAIVRRVVEHYHGRVGLDSTQGQGTTVWFTLPDSPLDSSRPASSLG